MFVYLVLLKSTLILQTEKRLFITFFLSLSCESIRILILENWSTDPHGSILTSKLPTYERPGPPWLHVEPPQLLKVDFDADSISDPALTSMRIRNSERNRGSPEKLKKMPSTFFYNCVMCYRRPIP
jgi:hypothetical protein